MLRRGQSAGLPDGLALADRINRLARSCRETGALVAHTRGWMRADGADLGTMGSSCTPSIVQLYTEGADTGCETAAREAAQRDLRVLSLSDGTATRR